MVRPDVKKKRLEAVESAIKSRKERKKLEQIVLRKKHKIDRNNVLAELKRVQLSPSQLDKLHSTSSMQTKGLKRFSSDQAELNGINDHNSHLDIADQCLNVAQLVRRKRRKIRTKINSSTVISSSSEDTDAVSTDAEIDERPSHDGSHKIMRESVRQVKDDIHDSPQPKHENFAEATNEHRDTASGNNIADQLTVATTSSIKNEENNQNQHLPNSSEPAIYVEVVRDPIIEKARLELPIIGEEHRIMEEIRYNDVVVISGETGSGKTTQLPQFLYEAGYTLKGKMIGITEPRRVAAVSMSERVSEELNLTENEVAYQIRFSGTVSESTQIKFMTDGVLLKECQHDFLLSRYSVLIIDEAHERSVFSDILIGLLSRIVPLRAKKGNPLKLIIMSATLRVSDFTENSFLFPKTPPIIEIDARQYPVTTKFESRTPENYLEAAFKKVIKISNSMPIVGGILVFVTSQMDVKVLCRRLKKKLKELHCLGLYAMLPLEKQKLVFKKPPEGKRLCVIATNVAETSITIPNIRYVVDTGMEKRKQYDHLTGVSRFITTWTSKSSAEQRAGRAGRMGPGYCYRLYSSAVFTNDFPEFSEPQILQKPVEDVLLQMKTMNIDNVVNFPFPTRPSIESLKAAEKKLILLGALDDSKSKNACYLDLSKTEYASRPTKLGKAMSRFSVSARCSKMIVTAPVELIPHVICLVSALTVREMFMNAPQFMELRRKWAGQGGYKLLGDYMVMLRGVLISEANECSTNSCEANGLQTKSMLEIDKLRRHLLREVKNNLNYEISESPRRLKKPSETQCKILRQLLLSSFCDHVAKKLPDGEYLDDDGTKRKLKNAYECKDSELPVYISSDSVLKNRHPDYVIYRELYKGDKKTYMRDIACIEPEWLS